MQLSRLSQTNHCQHHPADSHFGRHRQRHCHPYLLDWGWAHRDSCLRYRTCHHHQCRCPILWAIIAYIPDAVEIAVSLISVENIDAIVSVIANAITVRIVSWGVGINGSYTAPPVVISVN